MLFVAEKFLESIEGTQNYPLLLLGLINKENVPMHLRVSAGITLKNYVKRNWRVVRMEVFCLFVDLLLFITTLKCDIAITNATILSMLL